MANQLMVKSVKNAKPGRHGDGGGLYLEVKPTGRAYWIFRFMLDGKRRDMGLGSAKGPGAVGLAEARERAAEARRLVRSGEDPLRLRREGAATRAARARSRTFAETAELYMEAHAGGWRNAKHRAQWAMTLRVYAGPHLGALPVSEVETAHVAAALSPIWTEKPETASRLRGRIEAVLDFAIVHRWREGPNPARWRGHLDHLFPRRSRVRAVRHHAALPWREVPGFMARLRGSEGVAARALEFAILTAARTGEVLGARWSEVDLEWAIWTVPEQRMKAGREHRVRLAPAAAELLRALLPLRRAAGEPDPLVFPGQRGARPLSIMAMAMLLRRLGRGDITVHGFRSSFRDWAGEETHHAREVVEAALAHRLGDKAEQAYARGDLFLKRRALMEDWAAFCAAAPAGVDAPPAPEGRVAPEPKGDVAVA
jgi:integrase